MRFLNRILLYNPLKTASNTRNHLPSFRLFSSGGGNDAGGDDWTKRFSSPSDDLGWGDGASSTWSSGLTKEHFDGEVVGRQIDPTTETPQPQSKPQSGGGTKSQFANARWTDNEAELLKQLNAETKRAKAFTEGWKERLNETSVLMKQVMEPGARGSYLKDSEKDEMYRLHKENPEVYTVEKLAKDYRIMRQRVHAILWLKEIEEEETKKHGPLDNSVELLLDMFPEFFNSHDREFHVASLPYKPDFKVMPEGWDGTTRDPDEVHYEISMKEDEMLYQEFVQRMNFNKMKMAKQVKCHKYSRRRPKDGWNFTVEKMGSRGKRGNGGGWKFVSLADGSTRPLNELEKMFVKRETPRRRRKILP